ncbi:hypothetical protein PR202_ga02208 [Eleusine coracana subsp. coracana]|uniref:Remorin C-terminal domain-containing protein n=1 Tax=Eleusine coracana subsp. coracana TaxID=191504 RepID=A0AAV5BJ80_ELECO|nr:hypothetical protein PR202_ga02208 [Eleusine coracana subsp. coracana]
MAAVLDGFSSCGSTNVRRVDHLPPLPCIGEPTAASRVSPGSSPARSEASGGGACYAADAETEPEPEVSVGRSTQMLLAMAAMGGRGGQYGRRPASSYGSCAAWSAGSLTKHRPASPSPICSPVNSHGRGGGNDPEPHGGDDASSFATPRLVSYRILDALYRCFGQFLNGLENLEYADALCLLFLVWGRAQIEFETNNQDFLLQEVEQERLPTRVDFMKPSATPRNIRLQTPRQPSVPRRVEGANQLPSRFIHRATPARLMRRARSSRNYCQRVGAMDGINEWRLPKVSEEEDEEGDQKDWQADTVSSRLVIGTLSLTVPLRVAITVVMHLTIQMVRIAQLQDKGWRDGSQALCQNPKATLSMPSWLPGRVHRLKKNEADIDDWQKNEVAKARQKMRKTEMKLEKKRAQAGAKLQKKIQHAQRKADKKKVKEQAATANQIASVERALGKMSRTGKLPWSLAFL